MSLPHALLTSLIERPGSGLELAQRFDRSIGHFWPATHQQIYRELGRLEEAGWVESTPEEGSRGRKRSYQVLPAGREELGRWVQEAQEPRPLRDELMVRLRATAAIGGSSVGAELQRHQALHEEKLALFRQIEARDFAGKTLSQAQQLQYLVLTAGIEMEAFYRDFCARAAAILAEPPEEAESKGGTEKA